MHRLALKGDGARTCVDTFALWLTGIYLKGTDIERQVKVNSGQGLAHESPAAMSPLS